MTAEDPYLAGDSAKHLRVAVDTGGTFTDVAVSKPDGSILVWKVSSRPDAPDEAVVHGLTEALALLGATPGEVHRMVHGTTVATNTLLTRTGARVALITTEGFRDVIRIGHQTRPNIYDLASRRPAPLVHRSHTWEVAERIAADGSVLAALDEDAVRDLATRIKAAQCDVIVVSLLNAYVNPAHERRCAEILEQMGAARYVLAATSVTPEMREFERSSTAVVNGYVRPVIASYVERLERQLVDLGLGSRLWIMQSNGGLLSAKAASEQSVRTVLSGLAGGVMGAARWARVLGLPRVVSFDIGGTSTDIALIRDGRPQMLTGGDVEGYPLLIPAVDVNTIGAGGGSIAWRDSGGGLRVGPQSAGASPGPICYGRGGSEPTVTDAHLLLGRLGSTLLDGRLELDRERAAKQVVEFADILGMGLDESSAGILRVINATMARGVRRVSVERGVDVRECVLMAFGGAGPLHAAELVRELGMKSAVVPPHPGIASAVGMLDAPVRHDFAASLAGNAGRLDIDHAEATLRLLDEQARHFMRVDEGIDDGRVVVERFVDARYVGQSYELTVPWTSDLDQLRASFDAVHTERYGFADPEATFELVAARVTATAGLTSRHEERLLPAGVAPEPTTTRRAYFDGTWQDVPIYRRDQIPSGVVLAGPLVIEQLDSTTVVLPGQTCRHDEFGFLHIEEGQPV